MSLTLIEDKDESPAQKEAIKQCVLACHDQAFCEVLVKTDDDEYERYLENQLEYDI
jgi:hypothetical protein